MRIAAIQLCSSASIAQNLDAAEKLIRAAAKDGASFIATPEMSHIVQRAPKQLFEDIYTQANDPGVARFSALAKALAIDLLIGSLAIKIAPMRAANRSFLFAKDGSIRAQYDKIHLFDVDISAQDNWTESRIYERGTQAAVADINGARLGLSICYDLRFAALYRRYAQMGATILAIPAAFTRPTGKAHWEVLLRARAIETGSFVIAPAQGGTHEDGRRTWGHSMIIGPWGDIRAALAHDEPGYICTDIDIDDVTQARRKIPAWQHEPDYIC